MKSFFINLILIFLFFIIGTVLVLPLVAEFQLKQAKKLEAAYHWKKAGEKYVAVTRLHPFNSEYFAEAGDFLTRQSAYRKDKISCMKKAEEFYERACRLNPGYGEHWYALGGLQLALSREYSAESREKKDNLDRAVENFKKAVEKDPYGLRINYLAGYNLLTVWDFLDNKKRKFILDRLEYVLRSKPSYTRYIYPAVIYYVRDFDKILKVTPDTLKAHNNLYSFIKESNMWQFRKGQKERLDYYRQKEEPEEFKQERMDKLKRLDEIKKAYKSQDLDGSEGLKAKDFVLTKDWQGRSGNGKHVYEKGRMSWNGTVNALIAVPEGRSMITITAKGSSAENIFPYMMVELNGKEIGETFVTSNGWKQYSFPVEETGGLKVLSVTFANDGGNEDKREDRNLYLGGAKIIKNYE